MIGQAAEIRPARRAGPRFSIGRVHAMVMRHIYLMRHSWTRLAEMIYWPVMNVLMWGFISQFFLHHSDWIAKASGVLLGAVILWDILFRSNLGVSLSFLEEIWSRNLGHLAVSPLTPLELVVSMTVMSLLRTAVGMLPAILLAIPFYHFSLFSMGISLLFFYANLTVTGWALGLGVSALVLRYGQGAESLAWVMVVALAPFCGIYYPISSLPVWLQPIGWALPCSHIFEAMRAVLFGQQFPTREIMLAAGLNVVYVVGASLLFMRVHHVARVRGLFLGMGE